MGQLQNFLLLCVHCIQKHFEEVRKAGVVCRLPCYCCCCMVGRGGFCLDIYLKIALSRKIGIFPRYNIRNLEKS